MNKINKCKYCGCDLEEGVFHHCDKEECRDKAIDEILEEDREFLDYLGKEEYLKKHLKSANSD